MSVADECEVQEMQERLQLKYMEYICREKTPSSTSGTIEKPQPSTSGMGADLSQASALPPMDDSYAFIGRHECVC